MPRAGSAWRWGISRGSDLAPADAVMCACRVVAQPDLGRGRWHTGRIRPIGAGRMGGAVHHGCTRDPCHPAGGCRARPGTADGGLHEASLRVSGGRHARAAKALPAILAGRAWAGTGLGLRTGMLAEPVPRDAVRGCGLPERGEGTAGSGRPRPRGIAGGAEVVVGHGGRAGQGGGLHPAASSGHPFPDHGLEPARELLAAPHRH